MTNNEKALELVQKCLDDWPYAATRVIDIMKRLEKVKVLLKEQEPIAPSICGSKEPDGHGCWWYLCGKCKMPIAPKERFCRRCGQAVKWE